MFSPAQLASCRNVNYVIDIKVIKTNWTHYSCYGYGSGINKFSAIANYYAHYFMNLLLLLLLKRLMIVYNMPYLQDSCQIGQVQKKIKKSQALRKIVSEFIPVRKSI